MTALEERLVVLSQQVERLDIQLQAQSAALVSVTQQTDSDTAHLTTLADTLTTMSEQVQQFAQAQQHQPRVRHHAVDQGRRRWNCSHRHRRRLLSPRQAQHCPILP
jgi:hypothetical protein